CDSIENYARSSGSFDFKAHPDALVDTDVVANVTNQNPSNAKFKADFGMQVQRWINSEQQRLNRTGVQERTVFTVFFGISDVWQYVGLEDKEAHEGVRQSIRTLFAQLDVIAQFMRKPIQVVLPHIPDITFLPAFSQQPEGPFPTYQRSAVFLVEKWNTELERAAREFVGGSIHLLSLDKWLLEMLREQQMYTIGIADENGDGKRAPTFTETTSPCLPLPVNGVQYPFDMDDADSNRTESCTDASQYLFWDGMHLSSKAHRLLAVEAADLVSHNDTFNLNALRKHEQELAEKKEKEKKPDEAEMDSTDSEPAEEVEMSDPSSSHQVSGKSDRTTRNNKTSTAVSTRSRRTASPSQSKEDDGPLTPESPPFRLTRKRAASLVDRTEEMDMQEAEAAPVSGTHSRINSAGSLVSSDGSTANHVCLCQPDPKIPRPRNAFILYRQHHHAAIVAENPGLANPEISKIIGEQWRSEPESIREEWKRLADEEKLRHQQQYPEYRYQPRRGGRRSSVSNANGTPEKHLCTKCGGRSITTPSTPFGTTPGNAPTPMLPPPTPSPALTPTSRYLPPMMSNLAINANGQPRRIRHTPAAINIGRIPEDRDVHMLSPLSPDAKRRRYNSGYVPQSARPGPGTPYPFPPDPRRQSLPAVRPEVLRGPSPRSSANLTLPPLQTTTNNSPRPGTTAAPATAHPNNAAMAMADPRSVEAMVMSMPFWGKLRILGKISPPYGTHVGGVASPSSASNTPRGAIIAVEGDDRAVVMQMAEWLRDNLNKSGELDARVAEPPRGPPERSDNVSSSDAADVSLGAYIALVAEWHAKNAEMIDFIMGRTTAPPPPAAATATAARHAATRSRRRRRALPPRLPPSPSRTPILILPTFTLSAANAWAARIPIADAYSPADHWQWLATLWRGIVGPDVTVYVADAPAAPSGPTSASTSTSSGNGGNGMGAAGGMQTPGLPPPSGMSFGAGVARPVEVREEGVTRCVVVRRERRASATSVGSAGAGGMGMGMGMGIDESALRRLGFEVEELVRCCVGRQGSL
ncbi:uncharacterized protein IWZ02DRAFT_375012, partial [Phyllosticta citriasiana]|uniref:uncharacterized protein n=1 Tax=Phyllosticta citriasiana TaxID=595635 RepID=UPI0030FD472F